MSSCMSVLGSMLGSLFTVNLPWGIGFGAVIVGVFGAPLLVKAYKKFF